MVTWCNDYTWNKGRPEKVSSGQDFMILTDPYGKRFIIESYKKGIFDRVIYDSSLLDYRKLNPREQLGWLKEPLQEGSFLLRNREHTPILIEEYQFEGEKCRECRFFSPHRLLLGHQRIFYVSLGDPFNGVTLFDPLGKKVVTKKYALTLTEEFGDLISET